MEEKPSNIKRQLISLYLDCPPHQFQFVDSMHFLVRIVLPSPSSHLSATCHALGLTITEIEDSDSDHVSDTETELNVSLALLSKHFKKFGRKGNFRKSKPLSLTNKAETPSGDKASATCFKCQGKGHYATECRYKKIQFAESSSPASKEDKY
ncbi:hypothetical protein OSB04_un001315 [Centaurea solstitialis]|uniref:CCHC-type domain-containing protein n=1 Tax=Centaurea solstitialis TaxID=347529 RepID=A0AA38SNX0_9ASTR|nr:hypothetical protein OSB04_un001315 [Centaurea solstitialis]